MTTIEIASDNQQNIYLTLLDGKLLKLDKFGQTVWNLDLGGVNISKPYIHKENIYLVNNQGEDTNLKVINKETGIVVKTLKLNKYENVDIFKVGKKIVLFASIGELISFNPDSSIDWKLYVNARITTKPLFVNKQMGFGTSNGTFVFVDNITGSIGSQILVRDILSHEGFIDNNRLYTGDKIGFVKALDLSTQKITWESQTGGKIVEIKIFDENIIVSSNDNYVYLMSKKNGNKIWKRLLSGRIIGSVFLNKDLALFLTNGTNVAEIFDMKRGILVNKISLTDADAYFVSKPVKINGQLLLSTQKGLYSFSWKCKKD